MKRKLTCLLMFIYFGTNCFSQEKYALISGKIISSNKKVSDVHILNLNTKLGTVSNDKGEFELMVSLNDTLLFSSIEYERKKIRMTGNFIKYKKIVVDLIPSLNELEEIFIEGLTGSLSYDINKVPKDTVPQSNFLFKINDLYKKLPCDEYGNYKIVNAESFTNPLYLTNGAQGSKYNMQLEAERKLKRELLKKKEFPIKIKKELGIAFFTENLKIPEEQIDHFLAYCEYRGIIDKYYNNKVLEAIEILQEESKSYHEIKQ